jgi:hypothetical protein
MDLGIRQQESALTQYENERDQRLEEWGLKAGISKERIALLKAEAEMKHATSLAKYEAGRNRFLDLVKLLRYKDLSDDPSRRLFEASLDFSQTILEDEMDGYLRENPFSTQDEKRKFALNLVDQVMARAGKTPEARAAAERVRLYNEEQAIAAGGVADDSELSNDPVGAFQ